MGDSRLITRTPSAMTKFKELMERVAPYCSQLLGDGLDWRSVVAGHRRVLDLAFVELAWRYREVVGHSFYGVPVVEWPASDEPPLPPPLLPPGAGVASGDCVGLVAG